MNPRKRPSPQRKTPCLRRSDLEPHAIVREKVSVGVVGCGYWGPNLIRNFRDLPNCELRSMCDVSEERLTRLATLYPGVKGMTGHREMLEDPEVDAVAIAVPVRYHYPLARESLLAGKHTLIEKPMAGSVAECEELIQIAKHKGLVLMIGHTFLYSAAVRKIKEIVHSNEIGEVRYINARRLNLGLFQKDINVAWDLAPHDLSIILHILGESPLSINCQGNAHVTAGIEDVCNMSLTFGKSKFATIQNSWLEPRKIREMTIVGSRGMIVYDDLQAEQSIRIYDVRVDRPPHYDTFDDFKYSYHYGNSYIPYLKHVEPLKTQCSHFLDCIQNGTPTLTDGHFGLEIVRILEAASLSLSKNGASVSLASASRGLLPV